MAAAVFLPLGEDAGDSRLIANYYHTLKYVKPIQVIDRIKRKLIRVNPNQQETATLTEPQQAWVDLPLVPQRIFSMTSARFLNEQGSPSEWYQPHKSKLWCYNLHYFDDLNAWDHPNRQALHRELIDHWIKHNPPLKNDGWEPYPLSLRIVNWIKWFQHHSPESAWLDSLTKQAHVLTQTLEYHLLGNHLFSNAKALIFAGCYFSGSMAEKWLKMGLRILDDELPEQVLADGGNFELSPMYHAIMLTDLLDLINLTYVYPKKQMIHRLDQWKSVVLQMFTWMDVMTHPDGEISFFNDSAIGVAANYQTLVAYAQKLNMVASKSSYQVHHLKQSGYIRVNQRQYALLIDAAKVGPDYIPGHAHADTLSFEWSFGNQRVFVNSGTSVYGVSQERLNQRKTCAHNTVEVDGKDSSEVWGGFRVARRAYPSDVDLLSSEACIYISASHNGYRTLPGKVQHERTFQCRSNQIQLIDRLSGRFQYAKAYFHLHPEITPQLVDDQTCRLMLPTGEHLTFSCKNASVSIEASHWHPEFGLSVKSSVLIVAFQANEVMSQITW